MDVADLTGSEFNDRDDLEVSRSTSVVYQDDILSGMPTSNTNGESSMAPDKDVNGLLKRRQLMNEGERGIQSTHNVNRQNESDLDKINKIRFDGTGKWHGAIIDNSDQLFSDLEVQAPA